MFLNVLPPDNVIFEYPNTLMANQTHGFDLNLMVDFDKYLSVQTGLNWWFSLLILGFRVEKDMFYILALHLTALLAMFQNNALHCG